MAIIFWVSINLMGSLAFFIAVAIVAAVVWLEQTFSLQIKTSRPKTRVF